MHGLQTQRFVIVSSLALLILDRALKLFFLRHQSSLGDGLFTFVLNRQAAFSLTVPTVLWWLVTAVIMGWCLHQFFIRWQRKQNYWPWIFIILGASSNIYDRIVYGGVIDYINFGWWPVFNLSDSFIVLAVIWLLLIAKPEVKLHSQPQ